MPFKWDEQHSLNLACFFTLIGFVAILAGLWVLYGYGWALLIAGLIWLIIGLIGINAVADP